MWMNDLSDLSRHWNGRKKLSDVKITDKWCVLFTFCLWVSLPDTPPLFSLWPLFWQILQPVYSGEHQRVWGPFNICLIYFYNTLLSAFPAMFTSFKLQWDIWFTVSLLHYKYRKLTFSQSKLQNFHSLDSLRVYSWLNNICQGKRRQCCRYTEGKKKPAADRPYRKIIF